VEGRVRLGVMDDYGRLLLPPLLASFIANYPLIDVEMETGLTSTMTDRLGKTYNIVIAMHAEGHSEGELLRREQAVWAASAEHRAEASNPLPVALYPQGCLFRSWAMQALDKANRPWRLAFVSHSLSAVEAVAAQGLAVTVVKSGTFPSKLRRLSERDGLPPLPRAEIRLHRTPKLSRAATLLADHLVASLAEPVRSKVARR
jgi:DNA-binding transcriptional LysR family regulator